MSVCNFVLTLVYFECTLCLLPQKNVHLFDKILKNYMTNFPNAIAYQLDLLVIKYIVKKAKNRYLVSAALLFIVLVAISGYVSRK